MKINVQLEFKEFLESQVIGLSGCFAILIIGPLLLFFWFVLVASPYFGIDGRTEFLLVLFSTGYVFFFLIIRYAAIPTQARRIFRQQKNLTVPIEIEFSEQTVKTSSLYGNSEYPWAHFVKWREGENILMLYYSDALYTLLPKRSFKSEAQIEFVRSRLHVFNIPLTPPLSVGEVARITAFFLLLLFILTFVVITITNQQRNIR